MCEGLGRQGSSDEDPGGDYPSCLCALAADRPASDPLREGNQLVDHCFPPLFTLPPPPPSSQTLFFLFSNISAVRTPPPHPRFFSPSFYELGDVSKETGFFCDSGFFIFFVGVSLVRWEQRAQRLGWGGGCFKWGGVGGCRGC